MHISVWEPLVQHFKIPVPGSYPQTFWFDRSGLGSLIPFPSPKVSRCFQCAARDETLVMWANETEMDGPLLGFHSGFSGVSFSWYHQWQMVDKEMACPEAFSWGPWPFLCLLSFSLLSAEQHRPVKGDDDFFFLITKKIVQQLQGGLLSSCVFINFLLTPYLSLPSR